MTNNWMEKLNQEQIESVITCDKPLRVIAGAGSGKTRVITTKISYLITALDINPTKILAVTFTNKAANEMKERVRQMVQNSVEPFISTFHSLCTRILRTEALNCGLQKNFVIIDDSQQVQIIKKVLKENYITAKSAKEVKNFLYPISGWKNSFTDYTEAEQLANNEMEKRQALVYKGYEAELAKNNYVDFDDLLLKVHKLFKSNTEIREKWSKRFDYILVDEFQDTNQVQFDIVCWLNNDRNTITVVGDPDQTIYTWRGAEIRIIMDFHKKFTNAVTVKLLKNYRSTKKILDLANAFISHNEDRLDKSLESTIMLDLPIKLASAGTTSFEARYVGKEIKRLVEEEKKYKYRDIFVLYRINSISGNFERSFGNMGIPFKLSGGVSFRNRKVIKDISSMVLAVVSQDSYATERMISNIPKFGAVTIQKLGDAAASTGVSLFTFLVDYKDKALLVSKNILFISEVLEKAREMYNQNKNVLDIVKKMVSNLEYESTLKVTDENYEDNKQHIKAYFDQMLEFDKTFDADTYGTENRLEAFCQSDLLGLNGSGPEIIEDSVNLMTIHAAKGLENKVVFVVGINEGIFPSFRAYYSKSSLEEERRALYVAITRAQETLYLTYTEGEHSFLVNGNLHASRFINELDKSFLENESNIFFHSINEMSSNLGFSKGESETDKIAVDLKPGDLVNHALFGDGVVTKILNKQFIAAFNDPQWKVQTVPINTSIWRKK